MRSAGVELSQVNAILVEKDLNVVDQWNASENAIRTWRRTGGVRMIMSLTRRIRIDDDYLVNPGSGGQDKGKTICWPDDRLCVPESVRGPCPA